MIPRLLTYQLKCVSHLANCHHPRATGVVMTGRKPEPASYLTGPTNTVFLTDCWSIQQSLQSPGGDLAFSNMKLELSLLKNKTSVTVQWIPPHCGVGGNEEADRLSKVGSKLEQSALPMDAHRKLWGPVDTLRQIADFALLTGLKI